MTYKILTIVLMIISISNSLGATTFFSYGSTNGDQTLARGDDTSTVVNFNFNFNYYGAVYNSCCICINGYISFDDMTNYTFYVGPKNINFIAPFDKDLTTIYNGSIYYRLTNNASTLNQIGQEINSLVYSNTTNYMPTNALIVTWEAVPYYISSYASSNVYVSFQLIISTDGSNSFLTINYGPLGFNASGGYYYQYGYSLYRTYYITISSSNPELSSNVGVNGKWIYNITTFFSYGSANGDQTLARGDDTCTQVNFNFNFNYFGTVYTRCCININGFISFDDMTIYTIFVSPNNYMNYIAPFVHDLITTSTGNIYYRTINDSQSLDAIGQEINSLKYSNKTSFMPTNAFIVTWDAVPACCSTLSGYVSFQIIISTDGSNSFLTLNYGPLDFFASNGYYFQYGFNKIISISNPEFSSNVGANGKWIYNLTQTPDVITTTSTKTTSTISSTTTITTLTSNTTTTSSSTISSSTTSTTSTTTTSSTGSTTPNTTSSTTTSTSTQTTTSSTTAFPSTTSSTSSTTTYYTTITTSSTDSTSPSTTSSTSTSLITVIETTSSLSVEESTVDLLTSQTIQTSTLANQATSNFSAGLSTQQTTTTLVSLNATLVDILSSNVSFQISNLNINQLLDIFTGNIDTNNCLGNCSQNGLCSFSQIDNKFVCTCNQYFAGPTCSIDTRPCSSNPCLNQGTCIQNLTNPNEFSYHCDCGLLFEGSLCEYKIDVCKNETCSGNGNCVDFNNKPKCVCFSSYEGDKCETMNESLKTAKKIISTATIIAICVLVCLFLMFVVLDLLRIFWIKTKVSVSSPNWNKKNNNPNRTNKKLKQKGKSFNNK